MAQKQEQTEKLHRWEAMYLQLLRLSEEQRQLVLNHSDDTHFADQFARLASEWTARQEEILKAENSLKETLGRERFQSHFESNIMPIIEKIRDTIQETAARIHENKSRTGDSLRAVHDHHQLKRAYVESDGYPYSSIYFDQKK